MARARIKFWGVRGSTPAPGKRTVRFGGNTSCVSVECGGSLIVCEAGTGIRGLGKELQGSAASRGIEATILISHMHWDHYTGLPFFAPLFSRRNSVTILGPRSGRRSFGSVISAAISPPYFPVRLSDMPARIALRDARASGFGVGRVRVRCIAANHPGGALGWRFDFPGGKSCAVINDTEPSSGAGEERYLEALIGVDLLIHDAQYTPADYARRHGWGHSPFTYPVEIAKTAGVSQLYLTHFDPDYSDARLTAIRKRARSFARRIKCHAKVELASEGLSVDL